MPLLMVPYTLGVELPTVVGSPGGGAFYLRKKRFMAYILASLVLVIL